MPSSSVRFNNGLSWVIHFVFHCRFVKESGRISGRGTHRVKAAHSSAFPRKITVSSAAGECLTDCWLPSVCSDIFPAFSADSRETYLIHSCCFQCSYGLIKKKCWYTKRTVHPYLVSLLSDLVGSSRVKEMVRGLAGRDTGSHLYSRSCDGGSKHQS